MEQTQQLSASELCPRSTRRLRAEPRLKPCDWYSELTTVQAASEGASIARGRGATAGAAVRRADG